MPRPKNLYWFEERDEKFYKQIVDKSGADIMIYGHIHQPYGKGIFGKLFINAGSVGKPKDGDNCTCLILIEIFQGEVKTGFVRFAYNIEKVAYAIIQSSLPPYFADMLRQKVDQAFFN